jgi:hypothetical protein
VAKELSLFAGANGAHTWQMASFNRLRIEWVAERDWPANLPTAGILEVTVAPKEAVAPARRINMSPEMWRYMWTEVVTREVPIVWRLDYVKLLCNHVWLTCEQVSLVIRVIATSKFYDVIFYTTYM